jgi:hypothetical protein
MTLNNIAREANPNRINQSNTASDYGYLNILLNNSTDDMMLAEYNETRRQPILTNMNDFQLGVVRLKIPTTAIPLMVFEDDAYILAFSIGNNDTRPLVDVVTYDVPTNQAVTYPQNRYIFYYNQFLQDINNSLQRLWDLAIADVAYQAIINVALQVSEFAPYFRLSQGDSTYLELVTPADFTLNPSSPFTGPHATIGGINVLMSKKLFYFFSGFNARFSRIGFAGNPELNYKLLLNPSVDNAKELNTLGYEPLRINECNINIQDYPSLFLWQTLTRIIITTTIQIEKEVIITRDDQGRTERLEVLTDFEIPQTQKGLREYIYFYPQGQLRYSNFKASGWLDRFDLKVYFQTKDLSIFPVVIPPSFEVSLKIEFKRRKALNLLQYSSDQPSQQFF